MNTRRVGFLLYLYQWNSFVSAFHKRSRNNRTDAVYADLGYIRKCSDSNLLLQVSYVRHGGGSYEWKVTRAARWQSIEQQIERSKEIRNANSRDKPQLPHRSSLSPAFLRHLIQFLKAFAHLHSAPLATNHSRKRSLNDAVVSLLMQFVNDENLINAHYSQLALSSRTSHWDKVASRECLWNSKCNESVRCYVNGLLNLDDWRLFN